MGYLGSVPGVSGACKSGRRTSFGGLFNCGTLRYTGVWRILTYYFQVIQSVFDLLEWDAASYHQKHISRVSVVYN
jgi:hypothetical protein